MGVAFALLSYNRVLKVLDQSVKDKTCLNISEVTEIETIKEALITATELLKDSGAEAQVEAEFLLTYTLNIKRHELFLNSTTHLTEAQSRLFQTRIAKRAAGEPCQYITGRTEFMGLDIEVTPATLIPRPETEQIVEEVVKRVKQKNSPLSILDLCTGSGCLAVAIAVLLPCVKMIATDISKEALAIARKNAEAHKVDKRVTFLSGDLFNAIEDRDDFKTNFDLILANPPYIRSSDLTGLQSEVIGYEPKGALDGGIDGLDYVRIIVEEAPDYLTSGGVLIMEIGYDQAEEVLALLKASDRFSDFTVKKDLSGIERMVVATCA